MWSSPHAWTCCDMCITLLLKHLVCNTLAVQMSVQLCQSIYALLWGSSGTNRRKGAEWWYIIICKTLQWWTDSWQYQQVHDCPTICSGLGHVKRELSGHILLWYLYPVSCWSSSILSNGSEVLARLCHLSIEVTLANMEFLWQNSCLFWSDVWVPYV